MLEGLTCYALHLLDSITWHQASSQKQRSIVIHG